MSYKLLNKSTGETQEFDTKEERDQYVTDNDLSVYQGSLPELTVTVKRSFTQSPQFQDVFGSGNPIFGSDRVNINRRASQRNSNFYQNYDMLGNIAEGVNVMSGGILNRLSPTQNTGLFIDTVQGDNIMKSWFGNSGIVSDKFQQEHPYWSMVINGLGDAGTGYGINYTFTNPNIVAKLRHPTYKKYYHGTSADFNISEARMGSTYNSGLHASDSPTIAESMKTRGGGNNPRVEEFWAPKPSTEAIDVGDNGIRQLSSEYVIEPRTGNSYYDAAGDNTFKFDLIRKTGGNPVMIEGKPAFQIDKSVTLNLRKSSYPKIPESQYPEIDNLLHRYQSQVNWNLDALSTQTRRRLANINKRAAEIMSEAGYKVVKYNNTNPFEGGGGTSYFITDPSVIYQPKTLNFKLPWIFGYNSNK